jgi:8-hydroxy-5-deazaflavin:NADPH oxidoreductase
MKIGIIGSGHVGASVATLLARAGHEVRFGAREPRDDASLAGPVGTIAEATAFGDVVICAAPYGVWPDLARDLAPFVRGKVVIDAANPYPQRDGAFAQNAIDAGEGSGVPVAKLLPGALLVRAFNNVPWPATIKDSNCAGELLALPLAGDDSKARKTVAALIRDAGFEPVDAGALAHARGFDPGSPAYGKVTNAAVLKASLGEPINSSSRRGVAASA